MPKRIPVDDGSDRVGYLKGVLRNTNDPKVRKRFEKSLAKWNRRTQHLIDEIEESRKIRAEDLNLKVG